MPSFDEKIRDLIGELPEDYEGRAAALSAFSSAASQHIAEELAPALNAHIQAMPHDKLEQKQELAEWVNRELERFGLAVQCPKTGLPAKLRGIAGNWPGIGRFGFEVYIDGKRKWPTVSDKLPYLQLTDASPPKEQVQWQEAVVRRKDQTDRRR